MLGQRQLADLLSGRSVDRIAQCRHKRWNAWFADAARRGIIFDQVNIGLSRRIGHPGHLVVMKVGLVDLAASRRDLAGARNAGSEYGRALELRLYRNRIHHESGIDDSIDSGNDYLPV